MGEETKGAFGASVLEASMDGSEMRKVVLATSVPSRMAGLLLRPESDDLLVLMPCHDIHTFGMGYAIDVAFVDCDGRVTKSVRDVLPNKRIRDGDAAAVIERRATPRDEWFEEGEQLMLGRFRCKAPTGAGRKERRGRR